eukprot:8154269-Prorocentrum_lima.AAC.1
MAAAPLVRYAEELWRAASTFWRNGRVIKLPTLVQWFRAAQRNHLAGAEPRGPIGTMLRDLSWGGWVATNAT